MARDARRLSDVGEFGLIDRIARRVAHTGGPALRRDVRLGVGDDAALLRVSANEDVVVSTDALVEGVHFRFDQESPRIAGARAATAALSDLAAMGARPVGLTCAFASPPHLELSTALALLGGLVDQAARFGCPLVGGNVARASQVSLALTALGAVRRGRALRRDGARVGHRILVTGALGASALARARGRVRRAPEPRIEAGRRLARPGGASACIDVSDGLLADLGHLCRASGTGARIDAARVPRPRGFAAACRRAGLEADLLALTGGEDYELLFTVGPRAPSAEAWTRRLRLPVAEIGRTTPGGLRVDGIADAERVPQPGWRHF